MKHSFRIFFLATSLLAVAHSINAQTRAKDLAAMVAADRAFSKLSVDSSAQHSFDRYMTADAWLFRPRAVRALDFSRLHPLPQELILTWSPEFADVSRAGDLGFTTGAWASGSRRHDMDELFGQYLTIWRKQKDGRWLAVFNGNVRTPSNAIPKLRSPEGASEYVSKLSPTVERNSLLAADNSFSNIAKQRGYAEALRPIAYEDIRTLRHTFHAIGIDSIVATHSGARVTMWMPVEAVTAVSGDMGYTRGSYVISRPDRTNEAGDYMRVWRRDRNLYRRVGQPLIHVQHRERARDAHRAWRAHISDIHTALACQRRPAFFQELRQNIRLLHLKEQVNHGIALPHLRNLARIANHAAHHRHQQVSAALFGVLQERELAVGALFRLLANATGV
jgi:ketosteroid isomerase-like protein